MRPSVAARSAERALAGRQSAYREEVQRLIEAGVRVMQQSAGFDPPVAAILAEAGLSNQAFYRHFRSKDEFLLGVLEAGVDELVAYLGRRMQSVDSPLAQVRSWVDGVLAQALDPDAAAATRPFVIPQARLAERFPSEIASSIEELIAPLEAAIARALENGELPGADPRRDARALYDLAMGWLQRELLAPEPPGMASARHLADFALRGLQRDGGIG